MVASPATDKNLRTRRLRTIHAACRQMGLDEETRRAVYRAATGKDSAAAMGADDLGRVLDALKARGWRPRPGRAGDRSVPAGPPQGKARALWLTLYHLGEIASPEEAALDAFVKRQVGVDRLAWVTPADADRVIEALKAWAERAGVTWAPMPNRTRLVRAPKLRVIEAQWQRLAGCGAITNANISTLNDWLHRRGYAPDLASMLNLDDATADRVIEHLGRWLRSAHVGASSLGEDQRR